MGQYWMLVNLDKRQSHGDWGKLPEFIYGTPNVVSEDLFPLYCEVLPLPSDERPSFLKVAPSSLSLSNLPIEVNDMIFEQITSLGDCICLAVTSAGFWEVGRRHLKALMLEKRCSWAGDRIICLGDYCRPGHNPENVLTEEEIKILKHVKSQKGDNVPDQDAIASTAYTTSLYNWADSFSDRTGASFSRDLLLRIRNQLSPAEHRLLSKLTVLEDPAMDDTKTLVLRNLTEQVYIRGDVLQTFAEEQVQEYGTSVGFGEVVISNICWSADPSSSMRSGGDITQGRWAGHRFDITTLDMVENDEELEWMDASDDIVDSLRFVLER